METLYYIVIYKLHHGYIFLSPRCYSGSTELTGVCSVVERSTASSARCHTEQKGYTSLGTHIQTPGAIDLDRVPSVGRKR